MRALIIALCLLATPGTAGSLVLRRMDRRNTRSLLRRRVPAGLLLNQSVSNFAYDCPSCCHIDAI